MKSTASTFSTPRNVSRFNDRQRLPQAKVRSLQVLPTEEEKIPPPAVSAPEELSLF